MLKPVLWSVSTQSLLVELQDQSRRKIRSSYDTNVPLELFGRVRPGGYYMLAEFLRISIATQLRKKVEHLE